MAIASGIERYIPNSEVRFPQHLAGGTTLEVDGLTFPHLQTLDFPQTDPWSQVMRRVIAQVRQNGGFIGQTIAELGIGDGRNIREVGRDIRDVLGVDIEEWRLQIAGFNLVTGPVRLEMPVDFWWADAVELLQNLKVTGRERLSGWTIMCLPQSPEGLNVADRYDGLSTLASYRAEWDRFGLTLNAATLDSLRLVAASDLRTLIILSDRVPPEIRTRVIAETGWQIEKQFQTEEPVQQDPDTGIKWVSQIDDGRRFYELVSPQQYSPISAVEAERRRIASLTSGRGRDELNVYHHLSVYQLKPYSRYED